MQKVMDDAIMFDEAFDNHYNNVRNFLEQCRKNKISLNREKFKFAEDDVDSVEYSINSEGITATAEHALLLFLCRISTDVLSHGTSHAMPLLPWKFLLIK